MAASRLQRRMTRIPKIIWNPTRPPMPIETLFQTAAAHSDEIRDDPEVEIGNAETSLHYKIGVIGIVMSVVLILQGALSSSGTHARPYQNPGKI